MVHQQLFCNYSHQFLEINVLICANFSVILKYDFTLGKFKLTLALRVMVSLRWRVVSSVIVSGWRGTAVLTAPVLSLKRRAVAKMTRPLTSADMVTKGKRHELVIT